MLDLLKGTAQFLKRCGIQNKTVLAAVSGGADSSVLLYILNALKKDFNLEIKVIHLNHNWRGEESVRDFEFVQDLASNMGLEFYGETLDLDIKKTELSARDERYAFFERALQKFETDVCFLAHNKNDNAETLIYRVIKGTGPSGLASIPACRAPYYRPMLNFSRQEIEEYALAVGLKFRVDSSNDDTNYKRNFIRKNILPEMEKINKNAVDSINSLIKLSFERNEILEEYLKSVEKSVFEEGSENFSHKKPTIKRDEFLALKEPLQREIISRYFKGILKNRDFKNIVKIQNFIKENENSTLSINADSFLRVLRGSVFLYKKEAQRNDGAVFEQKDQNNNLFGQKCQTSQKGRGAGYSGQNKEEI